MLIHPPTLLLPKVRQHILRRLKRPILIADRRPPPRIAKSDNIPATIPCQVNNHSRVLIHLPPPCLQPEGVQHHTRRLKTPRAIAQRGPYPALSKSNDVIPPPRCQLRKQSRIVLHAPSQRHRDIGHAPSAQRARSVKLIRRRLRPRQLIEISPAIARRPKVRVRPRIKRLPIRRTSN